MYGRHFRSLLVHQASSLVYGHQVRPLPFGRQIFLTMRTGAEGCAFGYTAPILPPAGPTLHNLGAQGHVSAPICLPVRCAWELESLVSPRNNSCFETTAAKKNSLPCYETSLLSHKVAQVRKNAGDLRRYKILIF